MNGITIYIDWPYFLGIIGSLIAMVYYANGRFTKIETTVEWLKETLLEITSTLEDEMIQRASDSHSPFSSAHARRVRNPRP
jgi:hypothetical protein